MKVKVYGRVTNNVFLEKAKLVLIPGWQEIDINKDQFDAIKKNYLNLVTFSVSDKPNVVESKSSSKIYRGKDNEKPKE